MTIFAFVTFVLFLSISQKVNRENSGAGLGSRTREPDSGAGLGSRTWEPDSGAGLGSRTREPDSGAGLIFVYYFTEFQKTFNSFFPSISRKVDGEFDGKQNKTLQSNLI
jgi:hypothetical protein